MSDLIARVVIPGEPFGWQRSTPFQGRAVKPAQLRAYQQHVGLLARLAMGPLGPQAGAFALVVRAYFSVPPSWSAAERRAALAGLTVPTVKPDFDNIAKAPADAFNGIVWMDDAVVVDAQIYKRYDLTPRVEIEVRLAGSPEHQHGIARTGPKTVKKRRIGKRKCDAEKPVARTS